MIGFGPSSLPAAFKEVMTQSPSSDDLDAGATVWDGECLQATVPTHIENEQNIAKAALNKERCRIICMFLKGDRWPNDSGNGAAARKL